MSEVHTTRLIIPVEDQYLLRECDNRHLNLIGDEATDYQYPLEIASKLLSGVVCNPPELLLLQSLERERLSCDRAGFGTVTIFHTRPLRRDEIDVQNGFDLFDSAQILAGGSRVDAVAQNAIARYIRSRKITPLVKPHNKHLKRLLRKFSGLYLSQRC